MLPHPQCRARDTWERRFFRFRRPLVLARILLAQNARTVMSGYQTRTNRQIGRPPIKVTVCEMHDQGETLLRDWDRLVHHVHREAADLVLLPETPFCRPFVDAPAFDPGVWEEAIIVHERWRARLPELAPAVVMGTCPVQFGQKRLNRGFVWSRAEGVRWVDAKVTLRAQEGAWESQWYHPAPPGAAPIGVLHALVGMLIGSELWSAGGLHASPGSPLDLLVTPRIAGPPGDLAWIIAGSKAAKRARAYGLSSSRTCGGDSSHIGGWVLDPDGRILALTSERQPFVSAVLDLHQPAALGIAADFAQE
jgi:predicted amidohydrolase